MIKVLVRSYSDLNKDIMGLLGLELKDCVYEIELKDCVYEIEADKLFQAIKDCDYTCVAIIYDKDIDAFSLWHPHDL